MPHEAPPRAIILVEGPTAWPAALTTAVTRAGDPVVRIDDVRLVPFFVLAGGVSAVLVDARGLEMLGVLALRKCREWSPTTQVVVVVKQATMPAVKQALDSGATAFLAWSASPDEVARVLRGGLAP